MDITQILYPKQGSLFERKHTRIAPASPTDTKRIANDTSKVAVDAA